MPGDETAVQALIEAGHAYEVNGSVYFDVSTFPAVGRLSGNSLEDLNAGARIDVNPDKRKINKPGYWYSNSGYASFTNSQLCLDTSASITSLPADKSRVWEEDVVDDETGQKMGDYTVKGEATTQFAATFSFSKPCHCSSAPLLQTA